MVNVFVSGCSTSQEICIEAYLQNNILCVKWYFKLELIQFIILICMCVCVLGITWAYENFRAACMVVVTFGAIFAMLAFGSYLLFLTRLKWTLIDGYVTAAFQILSGLYHRLIKYSI